ncbi:HDIG domain-containing protein [Candidatus Acetothermia bacterium]|nr:HDIG domain-containing protein [Candidatus Acetothermia bacterium]
MATQIPTRSEAWALLQEFNQNENLVKHALAVEGVMRYMARNRGEDEEKWGIIGLIHDLDYERYSEQHCQKTKEILTERNFPDDCIRAVLSHGWKICTDVEPLHVMEKVLYAIDELTGLVMAVTLVRPSRSLLDLEAKSVRKKWKDKRFAAGANRAIIEEGAEMLGIELTDLIHEVIMGMREVAAVIGLQGEGEKD